MNEALGTTSLSTYTGARCGEAVTYARWASKTKWVETALSAFPTSAGLAISPTTTTLPRPRRRKHTPPLMNFPTQMRRVIHIPGRVAVVLSAGVTFQGPRRRASSRAASVPNRRPKKNRQALQIPPQSWCPVRLEGMRKRALRKDQRAPKRRMALILVADFGP